MAVLRDEEWLNEYEQRASTVAPTGNPAVPQMEPPISIFAAPLKDWNTYLRALQIRDERWLRQYDGLGVLTGQTSYLDVIREAAPIFDKDWAKLSSLDAKILLGLKDRNGNDYGLLGSMGRALTAKDTLFTPSDRNLPRRQAIVEALRSVIQSETGDSEFIVTIRKAYGAIRQFSGFGQGVTTRLLALARPDVLISINSESVTSLSEWSGITVPKLQTPEGYIACIQWVMSTKWWNSSEPKDAIEARVWKVRAAVLDGLAYRSFDFE